MTWKQRYLPPDPNQWQGPDNLPPASCFFQTIRMWNLLENRPQKSELIGFALIGFRCDEGVRRHHGRVGAAEGPAALRQALAKLPIQRQNFVCYDAGSISCADGDLEASQAALSEVITLLLDANLIPIALGGGHEIAWGQFQGIAKHFPKKHLGIINFDAHFDMSPLLAKNQGTSCTPFLQIAEAHSASNQRFDYSCVGIQHAGNIRQFFDTAKKFNTHMLLADEIHMGEKGTDFIDRAIDENEIIYASIGLDVFAAAFAPGVGAIQPLGLTPWAVIPLIRQLAASGKVVSFDIAELTPRYDIDHRTSKLAANLIYEFIHHYSLHEI